MTKDRGSLGNRIFLRRCSPPLPAFPLRGLFLFCGTTCVPAHNFQVSCGLYRADTCPTYGSLLSRLLISRFREPFRDETRSTSRPSKTIDRGIALFAGWRTKISERRRLAVRKQLAWSRETRSEFNDRWFSRKNRKSQHATNLSRFVTI